VGVLLHHGRQARFRFILEEQADWNAERVGDPLEGAEPRICRAPRDLADEAGAASIIPASFFRVMPFFFL
jgi:hypothetical protein